VQCEGDAEGAYASEYWGDAQATEHPGGQAHLADEGEDAGDPVETAFVDVARDCARTCNFYFCNSFSERLGICVLAAGFHLTRTRGMVLRYI
jgi:hypothetical protein